MACGGSGFNLTATTWADIADCHDNHVVDGATPYVITVAAGNVSCDSRLHLTKYCRVEPGGTVVLENNAHGAFSLGNRQTDCTVWIEESANGPIKFGGAGFQLTNTGDTSQLSPSGFIYITSSGGSYPVVIKEIAMPGGQGDDTNAFGGNFCFVQGRSAVFSGAKFTGRIGTSGNPNCLNGTSYVRGGNDGAGWTESPSYGSADTNGNLKIYVEDGDFVRMLECIDIKEGERFAVRHCTFTNSAIISHGADTETYGARYVEIYKSTFIRDNTGICDCTNGWNGTGPCDSQGNGHIGIRGGTSIIVDNAISAYSTAAWGPKFPLALYEEKIWRNDGPWACWGPSGANSGYPSPFLCGWGWDGGGTQAGNAVLPSEPFDPVMMDIEPVYIAGNTGTGNYETIGIASNVSNDCSSPEEANDYMHEDVEYYQQNASFDGTSGTGYGARASRPSSTTNGVAWWATNGGAAWNNGAVGGCLDKVVAGAWVDCWYTPYTYPHPMVAYGESAVIPTKTKRGKVGRGRH